MNRLPKIIKITLPLVFAGLLLILGVKSLKAQTIIPMTVAPARQQFSIDPGGSEYFNIKFINHGLTPLYGNLKVTDFIVNDDSGNPTLLDDVPLSTKFSGASWIKLPQDKATIAAGGILNLQLKISVPKDAHPGGRYVAISFEPTGTIPGSTGAVQEGVLGVSERIVGLVYVRVNGPITESAFVESFKIPGFVQFGPVPVSFSILNRGDYHIAPKGQVTFTDWFGFNVDSKPLEVKNIFPDVSRSYNLEIGNKWMLGRYKVALVASYGDTGKVLTQEAYVWAFPIMLVILIALAAVIIILLIMLLTNKLKKRERQLEEKLEEEISDIERLKNSFRDRMPKTPSSPSSPDKEEKK